VTGNLCQVVCACITYKEASEISFSLVIGVVTRTKNTQKCYMYMQAFCFSCNVCDYVTIPEVIVNVFDVDVL